MKKSTTLPFFSSVAFWSLGGLSLLAFAPLTPVHADPPPNTGTWQTTFHDNFAGQSSLNTGNWAPGWTWDYYPNSPSADGCYVGGTQDYTGYNGSVAGYPSSNVTFDAGGLVLTSQHTPYSTREGSKDFTSAVISTDGHFWQKYGYFEVRMQAASTPGLDTAFWMFARNHNYNGQGGSQELDVAEIPSGSNWNGTFLNTGVVHQSDSNHLAIDQGFRLNNDYHTYGVDWEPASVTWYLDGRKVREESDYVPQQEMYMMVSNELERDFGNGNWFGSPESGSYPVSTHVAWVHAWKKIAPPAAAVPIGHRIGFRSNVTGQYAAVDLIGGDPSFSYIKASSGGLYGWETFDVVDHGNGNVGLKSEATGKFLTVDMNQASRVLRADWATSINSWEEFQWVDLGNKTFALKSTYNGLYVSNNLTNEDGAYNMLEAKWSTGIGTWEQFTWSDAP